ncbi:MAG TPA: glycosyltransferase family 2 protein, partial [Chthonomonadaceae bacterium]|nr:glycosyltransferase family 2 protein [Chthonomonadaceae bacterium]
MDISIVICTRNRAAPLAETLQSIMRHTRTDGRSTELLVIDNGSTDGTAEIVGSHHSAPISVRHILEPRAGKCNAYNRGIAEARGEVLVWTDDDVRVPEDWAERVTERIFQGQADAVAGGVHIAPQLERPWMTMLHRTYLADTRGLDPERPMCMVGANMAFSRSVFARVPQFDTELGPGALGFCDETLFSMQLIEAGYRLRGQMDVFVEHHFDAARLAYGSLRDRMRKEGRCLAYIAHHWQHIVIQNPRLKAWKRTARL